MANQKTLPLRGARPAIVAHRLLSVCAVASLLFLAACAPSPNDLAHTAGAEGVVAGFWRGLWHGVIAPITFVISLFSAKVGMYEVHNNGAWYNFGFLLGILSFHGGRAATGVARRRRPRG